MSILSLEFVVFTIVTVIVYYIVPLKVRWWVMLAASVVFYALAGWEGCIWLLAVSAITYFSSRLQEKLLKKEKDAANAEKQLKAQRAQTDALQADTPQGNTENGGEENPGLQSSVARAAENLDNIEKDSDVAQKSIEEMSPANNIPRDSDHGLDSTVRSSKSIKKLRKLLLAVTVIVPLAAMAFVKYYDNFRQWFDTMPALTLLLPLGLSYFTFQCVGYCVDVYRGKFPAEKNPLKYLLFVSFFPQMTQGPISTYPQLMPQLIEGHRFNPDNFVMGAQLALWGFFKKMVIADRLADVTNAVNTQQTGWFILLSIIIYIIRLYADFSGGMDVIRGAARMLGVDMPENFRRPFFSFSVAEYWRRWHITLGTWFRNYVFYPITTSSLGLWLSKVGKKLFGKKAGRALPGAFSTVVIFFLIGIWHAFNGNAIIYGLYFGLIMGIEMLLDPWFKKLKKKFKINEKNFWWKLFTLVRTWVLVLIPQYFAFVATPAMGFGLLKGTFTNWNFANVGTQFSNVMKPLQWYIAAGAFVVMLVVDLICEKKPDLNERIARGHVYLRWPLLILLILAILVFGLYGTGYDATAFLYTHF